MDNNNEKINIEVTGNNKGAEDIEVKLNSDLAALIDDKLDNIEDHIDTSKTKSEKTEIKPDKNNSSEKQTFTNTYETGKSQPKSGKKAGIVVGCIIAALVIGFGGYYVYAAQKYTDTYLPGTIINGIRAEGMTPDEIKNALAVKSDNYSMTLISRGRANEIIGSSDVGLHYVTDTAPDDIKSAQNKYTWLFGKFKDTEHKITTTAAVDEDRFNSFVGSLPCFDDDTCTSPEAEHIGEYDPEYGFAVVPEKTGNFLADKESAKAEIKKAILSLTKEFDLEMSDGHLYKVPHIGESNPELIEICDNLNALCKVDIDYEGYDLTLNGQVVSKWLKVDKSAPDKVVIPEDKITDFVSFVAATYDTKGKDHVFYSAYGEKVMIEGGTFGWEVDQVKEAEELRTAILEGYQGSRRPVFKQEAVTFGETDYGDSYVEVNLTAQHVYLFKDGKCILHCDCVTGLNTASRKTPQGAYSVFAKQTGRTLRGPRRADGTYEYESFVNYWMPFNKGIGLHDATWRGSFGGTIWKYNGSHGCVNLPKKYAKQIYETIDVGYPVMCYFLEGTLGAAENGPEPETTVAPTTQATKPAATKPAATKPAATQPQTLPSVAETIPETQANPVIIPADSATQPLGPGTSLPVETSPVPPETAPVGPGGAVPEL